MGLRWSSCVEPGGLLPSRDWNGPTGVGLCDGFRTRRAAGGQVRVCIPTGASPVSVIAVNGYRQRHAEVADALLQAGRVCRGGVAFCLRGKQRTRKELARRSRKCATYNACTIATMHWPASWAETDKTDDQHWSRLYLGPTCTASRYDMRKMSFSM